MSEEPSPGTPPRWGRANRRKNFGDYAARSPHQWAAERGAVYPQVSGGIAGGTCSWVITQMQAFKATPFTIRLRPRAPSTLQALPCIEPWRPLLCCEWSRASPTALVAGLGVPERPLEAHANPPADADSSNGEPNRRRALAVSQARRQSAARRSDTRAFAMLLPYRDAEGPKPTVMNRRNRMVSTSASDPLLPFAKVRFGESRRLLHGCRIAPKCSRRPES